MKLRRDTIPTFIERFHIEPVLFFVSLFLYVWLVIDTRLIHHAIGIFMPSTPFSYSSGWLIFQEHLSRPAGLSEYATRWLTQYFSFAALGALIITVAAWLMAIGTDLLTRVAGRPRTSPARYLPAILLLIVWAGYHQPLRPVLALLVVLACFALYQRVARRSTVAAITAVLVITPVAYYVAGATGLLFPTLVAIYEVLVTRRALVAVASLLALLSVPWLVGMIVFQRELQEACGGFTIDVPGVDASREWYVVALYAFFPSVLALSAVLTQLLALNEARRQRRAESPDEEPSPASRTFDTITGSPGIYWPARMILVLALGGTAAWIAYDSRAQLVFLIDYYAQRSMWSETLEAADRMPAGQYHTRCNRNIMLALYHTGRLGDEMFRYTQIPSAGLYSMPPGERGPHCYFQESRLFLQLGQVNLAEKWACEAFECEGDLPVVLKQLAIINVVKDRPETARMFLTALSKKPLHRREALEMLEQLKKDPRLDSDPDIHRIRQCMIKEDRVAYQSIEEMLQHLLEHNPKNRMAFELLLAHYLHICRPDKVAELLQQPTAVEYTRMPRHYQEAIVINSIMAHGKLPSPSGQLDSKTIEQAEEMDRILGVYGRGNPRTRNTAIAEGLGDSFYFYFNFQISGL